MSRSQGEINRNVILTALLDHPSDVMETLTDLIIGLGAMSEWDMEQNFCTTESIAALAGKVGLHHAGDQSREGHEFYALAARAIGYDDDFEDDEEECPECGETGYSSAAECPFCQDEAVTS